MALTEKQYERMFSTTGSDADLMSSDTHTLLENRFDSNDYLKDTNHLENFGEIYFQMQKIMDELDYLRSEISTNKDKTGISTAQANAITSNTAKDGFPGFGTTAKTALAGNTTTITDTQARAISTNTTNIDNKLERRVGKNQSLICLVEEDKNGDHTLVFTLTIKDEKTGKTVRKTATLQLR